VNAPLRVLVFPIGIPAVTLLAVWAAREVTAQFAGAIPPFGKVLSEYKAACLLLSKHRAICLKFSGLECLFGRSLLEDKHTLSSIRISAASKIPSSLQRHLHHTNSQEPHHVGAENNAGK